MRSSALGMSFKATCPSFTAVLNRKGLPSTWPAAENMPCLSLGILRFSIITLRQAMICSAILMWTGQTSEQDPHSEE